MQIELIAAQPADRQRLENLLELYLHDFSEIMGFTPGDNGRFGYDRLGLYWKEPQRFPYLIRADQRLAGFALVSRGSEVSGDAGVYDMTEFFVVRGLRRHGVGLRAAQAAFAAMAGPWEVRVNEANTGALRFWPRAIAGFTQGRFETLAWTSPRGTRVRVFRFASPADQTPA